MGKGGRGKGRGKGKEEKSREEGKDAGPFGRFSAGAHELVDRNHAFMKL